MVAMTKKTESGTGLDSLTECLNQISKHTFPTSYSPRRVLFTTKVITVGQISISLSLKQWSSKQEGDTPPPRPQLSCWWHLDHTDGVITCSVSSRNLGVGSPALHRSRTLNVRLGQVVEPGERDEPGERYVKWNKPDAERQSHMISFRCRT